MRRLRPGFRESLCWISVLGLGVIAGCFGESTTPKDMIGPSTITDLDVADVTDSTVVLTWTAPGDDRGTGQAARYELRTLSSPMSEQDWQSGIVYPDMPAPAAAGTVQQVTVRGLPSGELRYFALKAADEVPNWSLMSKQCSATPGPPRCAIEPDTLEFGRVAVGTQFDISLEIRNVGGGTLAGEVASSCPDFPVVLGTGAFRLRSGQSHAVQVRFAPTAAGAKACVLDFGTSCGPLLCTGAGESVDPGLVLVEPGAFFMGSPEDEPGREEDEERHVVTLTRSFYVSDHEVTQAEWRALMHWNESSSQGADRPVEQITWFDALQFCNLLSQRDGYTPAYTLHDPVRAGNHITKADLVWDKEADGYRLLTEAEWEYACRAGAQSALYNGDLVQLQCIPPDPNLDRAGWYCGNSYGVTHPVRMKEANASGLYDMLGNVYEWCWDWYDRDFGQIRPNPGDPLQPQTDPAGPVSGDGRVVRGGSWFTNAEQCRCAYRIYHAPDGLHEDVGLRIGRNAP